MSRYYTKPTSTLPSSRAVFFPDKRRDAMAELDARFNTLSPDDLSKKLQAVQRIPKLDHFRLYLFGLSRALSNHGIAPRWQGLLAACGSDEQDKALRTDAHLIDLYWLSLNFPKHKAPNKRWRAIFEHGFDLELGLSIGERQLHTARKTAQELDLSPFQQIGCIHFCRRSTNDKLISAKKRSETTFKREKARAAAIPQIKEETAHYRAQIQQCWLLADESPTKAATIHRWMTGRKTDRATIKRTVKRMNKPVSRTQVE